MTEFIATCPYRDTNAINKQETFPFELPPPPPPPNEDQLRGYIHPLSLGAVSQSTGAGNLPILTPETTVDPPSQSDAKIDAHLLSRIRRGRDAGLRAVGFDEDGDLINAEELYMEALSVLIQASRDLDRGPKSNRSARLREKNRVQREASAMLNRCERLRSLIEVDDSRGPGVPQELPNTLPGARRVGSSNTRIDKHNSNFGGISDSRRPAASRLSSRTDIPNEQNYIVHSRINMVQNGFPAADVEVHRYRPDTARRSVVRRRQPHMDTHTIQLQAHPGGRENSAQLPNRKVAVSNSTTTRSRNANLTVPKNLDFSPQENIKSRTLPMGMSGMRTVGLTVPDNEPLFESQYSGPHTAGRNGSQGYGRQVDVERCVVCGDAANFRARCGHGFCAKCRNQCVGGLGSCAVFTCNNVLSVETFERMA